MKVIIQSRGIELSDALRGYCEAHLVEHIRRFYDNEAAQLVIQFNDMNGTKGGLDQEVHLTFHMPNARAIHVEERTEDAYKSLDLARDRLIRRIKEEIRRMRQATTHPPIDRPLGRTAAASERQLETLDEEPDASEPHVAVEELVTDVERQ